MAAVFCASLSRRAMVWRSRVIGTRSSRSPSEAGAGSGAARKLTVDRDGAITLSEGQAAHAAGTHPLDLAMSENGRFLYVLQSFTHSIGAYRVAADGSLTAVAGATNILMGAGGLAAR